MNKISKFWAIPAFITVVVATLWFVYQNYNNPNLSLYPRVYWDYNDSALDEGLRAMGVLKTVKEIVDELPNESLKEFNIRSDKAIIWYRTIASSFDYWSSNDDKWQTIIAAPFHRSSYGISVAPNRIGVDRINYGSNGCEYKRPWKVTVESSNETIARVDSCDGTINFKLNNFLGANSQEHFQAMLSKGLENLLKFGPESDGLTALAYSAVVLTQVVKMKAVLFTSKPFVALEEFATKGGASVRSSHRVFLAEAILLIVLIVALAPFFYVQLRQLISLKKKFSSNLQVQKVSQVKEISEPPSTTDQAERLSRRRVELIIQLKAVAADEFGKALGSDTRISGQIREGLRNKRTEVLSYLENRQVSNETLDNQLHMYQYLRNEAERALAEHYRQLEKMNGRISELLRLIRADGKASVRFPHLREELESVESVLHSALPISAKELHKLEYRIDKVAEQFAMA